MSRLTRCWQGLGGFAVALLACGGFLACGHSARAATVVRAVTAPNPIQAENALPGTTAWQIAGQGSANIQGYASQMSVAPGDTLQLHVSTTPAANYRIEIYRLGWYHGAGGRLITCLPGCSASEVGTDQPSASSPWLGAGWPTTDSVVVGSDWTTGYYLGKLVLTSGPDSGGASYIDFVVRAAPGTRAPILVQASVNTWEAYNNWGGKSLYQFNSSGNVPATQVSFQRPLDPSSGGSQSPLDWEYQIVRFLERSGYDVSYQTDIDTDENPSSLLGHHLDIVNGHDEYWSQPMRNAWTAARDAGVNLAFLGGDIGTWHTRYGAGDSTLYEYRTASADPDPNPAQKTVLFSQLNQPECELLGVGFSGGLKPTSAGPDNYTVTSAGARSPWFAGTGLTAGQQLFDTVGYEWETIQPGCAVPPVTDLLHFSGSPANADAVSYTASSGATVFSDGSLQLAWALDSYGHSSPSLTNAGVQALFTNALDALGGSPGVVDQPPSPFALRSPARHSIIWNPRPTLRWTASGDPDGHFSRYVVRLDGRIVATTTATSYTPRRALSEGRHSWSVQARDLAGSTTAGPWTFRVSSVRLASTSRPHILRHGLAVVVFCPQRCALAGTVTLGAHGPRVAFHGAGTRGRRTRLGIGLSSGFAAALARSPHARLTVVVRERSGTHTRRVHVTVHLSG